MCIYRDLMIQCRVCNSSTQEEHIISRCMNPMYTIDPGTEKVECKHKMTPFNTVLLRGPCFTCWRTPVSEKKVPRDRPSTPDSLVAHDDILEEKMRALWERQFLERINPHLYQRGHSEPSTDEYSRKLSEATQRLNRSRVWTGTQRHTSLPTSAGELNPPHEEDDRKVTKLKMEDEELEVKVGGSKMWFETSTGAKAVNESRHKL